MDYDSELDLCVEKSLKSPRLKIWECWTKPEHIRNFFVPKPHSVTECEMDFRVGGRFNTTILVDGNAMENTGVFLEIMEGSKLVFTDGYSEGWKPAPEPFMTAMILLEDGANGGTEFKLIARHRTVENRMSHEEMGFLIGWGIVAEQLDEYASTLN